MMGLLANLETKVKAARGDNYAKGDLFEQYI